MYANILMEKIWIKTLIVVISESWNFRNFLLSKSTTLNINFIIIMIKYKRVGNTNFNVNNNVQVI